MGVVASKPHITTKFNQMKKHLFRTLLVILLSFTAFSAFSQTAFSLQGTVIDSTNRQPMDGASVVLLSAKDSMYVTMVMTDVKGAYSFPKVSGGNYLVAITYLGYKNLMKPIMLTGTPKAIALGTFSMARSMFDLAEVEVSTVYNPIIIKKDTIEYVASAFKIDEGDMVEDLVKKLPGVEVDMDGNITANGKAINRVYVDGKQFFGSDPKMATRNLPANIVDRIQIIERQSDQAQFTGIEDMDTETVMNITLRSDRKNIWMGLGRGGLGSDKQYDSGFTLQRYDGGNQFAWINAYSRLPGGRGMGFTNFQSDSFSGNRSRGQGMGSGGERGGFGGGSGGGGGGGGSGLSTSWQSSLSVNREYSDNLNVNMNYSFTGSKSQSESGSHRQELLSSTLELPGGGSVFLDSTNIQDSRSTSTSQTYNHRLGMEIRWTIDSLRSLIFSPSISYGGSTSESASSMQKFSPHQVPLNDQTSWNTSDRTSVSLSGNLNFNQRFTKRGRTFSVALSGDYGGDGTDNYSNSQTMSMRRLRIGGENVLRKDSINVNRYRDTENTSYSYNSRFNYTEPLFTNHTLQLSYTLGKNTRVNDANSWDYDTIPGTYSIVDTVRTDYSDQKVTSQRYQIDFNGRLTKISYTLGFSSQYEVNKTNSTLRGEIKQTKRTLSPTFDFRYSVNSNTNFRFQFRGNTTPPTLDQLKPINTSDDPLYQRIGNEDLKTSFTGNYTLSFDTYNREKMKTFRMSASYSNSKNSIVNRVTYDDFGTQITQPVNVNGNWNGSGNVTYNTPVKGTNFTLNNNASSSYSNRISFSRIAQIPGQPATDYEKGTTKSLRLSNNLNIRYMNLKKTIEATTIGSVSYNKTWYSVNPNNNNESWNFRMTESASVNLPFSMTIKSDFTYSINKGMSAGIDMNSASWNAQLTKLLFKRKQGAIIFKINDILKDQEIYTHSASESYITDSWSNKITQYYLVTFQYRFTVVGKTAKNQDAAAATGGGRNGNGQRTGGQGGQGGGGGRGGGGGGFGGGGFGGGGGRGD